MTGAFCIMVFILTASFNIRGGQTIVLRTLLASNTLPLDWLQLSAASWILQPTCRIEAHVYNRLRLLR